MRLRLIGAFVVFGLLATGCASITATADIPRLKTMLVDQICEAAGGPCKYRGANMVDAHKGMKISDGEFTALVEDLVKSLDKFKVPEKEKNELLGILGPLNTDIVTA